MARSPRLLAILIAILLPGCGTTPPDDPPAEERLRVAAIFPGSPDGDPRWAEGLSALERMRSELGARVQYGEGVAVAQAELYLREYAKVSDIVLALDPLYLAPALRVAQEFPDTTFHVFGAERGNGRNVVAAPLPAAGSVGEAMYQAARRREASPE